jgi:hypothetical protein
VTIVVGAGPVGLFAALAMARRGPVMLVAKRFATVATTRIDSVPLGLLALLIEFGIPPGLIRASAAHDATLVAWDSDEPKAFPTPAKAHIDRNLLERELWRRVEFAANVTVTESPEYLLNADRQMIDATGRNAWSANEIISPPMPWVARTVTLPGRFGKAQQALRIAALPEGYIYRSAVSDLMTLGFVGPRRWHREIESDPNSALEALGLRWMQAGLAPAAQWQAGRGGVASLQWARGTSKIARIGDANLACDALASQGIALGMSDALALARDGWVDARLSVHLSHLRETIARCRFAHLPAWREYAHFLVSSSKEAINH